MKFTLNKSEAPGIYLLKAEEDILLAPGESILVNLHTEEAVHGDDGAILTYLLRMVGNGGQTTKDTGKKATPLRDYYATGPNSRYVRALVVALLTVNNDTFDFWVDGVTLAKIGNAYRKQAGEPEDISYPGVTSALWHAIRRGFVERGRISLEDSKKMGKKKRVGCFRLTPAGRTWVHSWYTEPFLPCSGRGYTNSEVEVYHG